MVYFDLLNDFWPLLGLLTPFIQAVGVKYNAERRIKQIASYGLTALAVVASVLAYSWTDIDLEMVATRAVVIFGFAQAVYRSVDYALTKATGKRLNKLTLPESGIG